MTGDLLERTTPIILTFDEAPNIGRCLDALTWAKDIVVVDSGSTDETVAICRRHPAVRVFTRPFDDHRAQWSFALTETGIESDWVLALDCDYMVTPQAAAEMARLDPDGETHGYWVQFRYALMGKVLRSGIYPPVVALFRRSQGRYVQDGHTQRIVVDGPLGRLQNHFVHDDRKPFDRWMRSQINYARLEADKLSGSAHGLKGWLRTRTPFSPLAVGFLCLIARGGLLEGPPGWLYALQRMIAEAMISAAYFDQRLRRS